MADDTPNDPPDLFPPDYLDRLPPLPPLPFDPKLIGDLQRPEKSDLKRKRRWFGLRSRAPA